MSIQQRLYAMETEARAMSNGYGGTVTEVINGHQVSVMVISAMINRGMATGCTYRATWRFDGKRIAYANIADALKG